MLATKLLELGANANIDLYELHPQERQRYVKLFCNALVNCPKSLYHPVVVILDEAHDYVPESKPSEATYAVEELASKGRKRSQCLILASQRISKISKNATAECNNKLIGRASQDIDMARAGEELGFPKRQQYDKSGKEVGHCIHSLRKLKPGEFFAFGTAISDEVIRVKVGGVNTSHAKASYKSGVRTPKPSAVIRKILGGLKDLPAEAEKEMRTLAEMKSEITKLRQENARLAKRDRPATEEELNARLNPYLAAIDRVRDGYEKETTRFNAYADGVAKAVATLYASLGTRPAKSVPMRFPVVSGHIAEHVETVRHPAPLPLPQDFGRSRETIVRTQRDFNDATGEVRVGAGETAILRAAAQYDGITRQHLTVLTGYKRSSRDTYVQRLRQCGFVEAQGDRIAATEGGRAFLSANGGIEPLPTGAALQEKVLRELPEGERKILGALIGAYPAEIGRDAISEMTGYLRSSRDTYLQRLRTRELVVCNGRGNVKAADELFG